MSESYEQNEPIEEAAELTPDELNGVSGGVIGLIEEGIFSYVCPGCWAEIEADSLASLKQRIKEHEAVCPGPAFPII